ncbi:transcription factor DIVARICATA-like [Melia azedarach]|uniref:Transcription factor DIVARICATA-like n=1 Tax=Melia azedarach TaxID=155640 RepID=A0ACC1X870_MELAZ|nr:transcription factor DIVARICATA-like [Melia azedarach]
MSGSSGTEQWSWEENKAFENGVAMFYNNGGEDEWVKIRSLVPTKTIDEIKLQFKKLVEDLELIESGIIPDSLPYEDKKQKEK